MLSFRKFPVPKKFTNKRGGEYQDFLSKIFGLSAEVFRRETLLCFRNFRVSKHFMPKRGLSRFPIENLLSHSTENFVGQIFCI